MPDRLPLLFAHRGGRAHAPENSAAAFASAVARGATALESDVRLTRDGVAVLAHDAAFGIWPRRRQVAESLRDELRPDVLTLPELYRLVGGRQDLSLDVKAASAFGACVVAAKEADAVRRLWACGTFGEVVRWREADTGVRLVHSTRAQRLGQRVGEHARVLADRGVDALNLPRRDWTASRVAAVKDAGVLAFGWDAHTEPRARQLLAWGCDGVYGDDVDALLAAAGRVAGSGPAR